MGVEWEEYRPVVGEPYSPGTQYRGPVTGEWFGARGVHNFSDFLEYRRPKLRDSEAEVRQLKVAVKELAQVVKDLVYFGIDHEGLSSRLDSVLSDLL